MVHEWGTCSSLNHVSMRFGREVNLAALTSGNHQLSSCGSAKVVAGDPLHF